MNDRQPSPPAPPPPPQRKSFVRRWLPFAVRWGIAILGIWWVVANLSLHDQVMIASAENGWPVEVRLSGPADEEGESFQIIDPDEGTRTVHRSELLARVEPARIRVSQGDSVVTYDQLARRVLPDAPRENWPIVVTRPRNLWQRFWNLQPSPAHEILPSQIMARRAPGVPYPLIEQGLLPMISNARTGYLWAAVGVFPIIYFITCWRWHVLLRALSIQIPFRRAFVVSMVGCFYNSFMPGSTGGDLIKAWYIAKHTSLRTRAVMSVIVDRILGLLALIILGGCVATMQYFRLAPGEPERLWCGRVAAGSGLLLAVTGVALFIFYHPSLRKLTGLDFVIRNLPLQTQVRKAVEAMEIYRRQPLLILWAIIITLPVHGTVVISAMLAGFAFDLPLKAPYYWVVVPVVVLSGAVPISPQGAGVMEFFAIMLTRRQGATVSQAFALTMSIRLVQIFWNLVGGIFVLRGGYHAPSEQEQKELEAADESRPSEAPAV